MLNHQLMEEEGVLVLAPSGPLQTADFQSVTKEVDPFIEGKGNLTGIMIEAEHFPGWSGFSAMLAHFRFVRDHHKHIGKVALVTDGTVLSILPHFASHFVAAEVRHFPYTEKVKALTWLREGSNT